MSKIYFKDWLQQYQVQADEHGSPVFIEPEELGEMDAHYVWTELSDMNGTILPGRRFVNRMMYLISAVPWQVEDYHTLEVTDLITKADYLAEINRIRHDVTNMGDFDEETVELLTDLMNEEFPDGE